MFKMKRTYSELKWLWFKKRVYRYTVKLFICKVDGLSCDKIPRYSTIVTYRQHQEIDYHMDSITNGKVTRYILPKLDKTSLKDAYSALILARKMYLKCLQKNNKILGAKTPPRISVSVDTKLTEKAMLQKYKKLMTDNFNKIIGEIFNEG